MFVKAAQLVRERLVNVWSANPVALVDQLNLIWLAKRLMDRDGIKKGAVSLATKISEDPDAPLALVKLMLSNVGAP